MRPLLQAAQQSDAGIEILGSWQQGKLPEIMGCSHVMVLPSIEDGFGLVQAQALACGCPVIASRNTGAEDLFTDGVEGYIVPIRSPDILAERLQRLADDPEQRQRMSAAALQRVQCIGGWDLYGENIVATVKELLHARQ
jgi:starch synthase